MLRWKGFPGAQEPRWSVSWRLAQKARESIRDAEQADQCG